MSSVPQSVIDKVVNQWRTWLCECILNMCWVLIFVLMSPARFRANWFQRKTYRSFIFVV